MFAKHRLDAPELQVLQLSAPSSVEARVCSVALRETDLMIVDAAQAQRISPPRERHRYAGGEEHTERVALRTGEGGDSRGTSEQRD